MKFPRKIRIGGQDIEVNQPNVIEGDKLGSCLVANGFINIAGTFNGKTQSQTSRENTFWHEIVHSILDTMGRGDLSADEVFVCSFAGFLTECYRSMEEDWKDGEAERL